MANVLSLDHVRPSQPAGLDARELSRKLDLIEDRPEAVLTWADVARHARDLWRRVGSASR
jgi:hypothetical protein